MQNANTPSKMKNQTKATQAQGAQQVSKEEVTAICGHLKTICEVIRTNIGFLQKILDGHAEAENMLTAKLNSGTLQRDYLERVAKHVTKLHKTVEQKYGRVA